MIKANFIQLNEFFQHQFTCFVQSYSDVSNNWVKKLLNVAYKEFIAEWCDALMSLKAWQRLKTIDKPIK